MFDVGFSEMVMVALVALLVVGPQRLPGLAQTAGRWIGKARHFVTAVKGEIEREIKAEELKRILEEQTRVPELHQILEDLPTGQRQPLAAPNPTIKPDSPPPEQPTLAAATGGEPRPDTQVQGKGDLAG